MSDPSPPPIDPPAIDPQTLSGSLPVPPSGMPLAEQLPKIVRFDSLARCGEEVWIENEGQIYRLRRTRAGKLILTK